MSDKIKVFIVEDEIDVADLYKIKLEKEWFEVKVANDWFKALTMIWEFLPDIILMDIMMPNMDWFESVKNIRQLAPSLRNTKIIMFSNLNSKNDIKKALKNWADDYLLKADTTPKEVVEKINSYLKIKKNKKTISKKIINCPHCWKEI